MAEVINSSFIPKTEFKKEKKRKQSFGINIFFLISLIIFLSAVVGSIGVYMWKKDLVNSNKKTQLKFAKDADKYGTDTIEKFALISSRIENTRELLSNHYNLLPIFEFLEKNTLTDIYYNNISLDVVDDIIKVSGKGIATDLPDLSLQSNAYAQNPNLEDLVISNITRSKKGYVSFDLDFSVNKKYLTSQQFLSK